MATRMNRKESVKLTEWFVEQIKSTEVNGHFIMDSINTNHNRMLRVTKALLGKKFSTHTLTNGKVKIFRVE